MNYCKERKKERMSASFCLGDCFSADCPFYQCVRLSTLTADASVCRCSWPCLHLYRLIIDVKLIVYPPIVLLFFSIIFYGVNSIWSIFITLLTHGSLSNAPYVNKTTEAHIRGTTGHIPSLGLMFLANNSDFVFNKGKRTRFTECVSCCYSESYIVLFI